MNPHHAHDCEMVTGVGRAVICTVCALRKKPLGRSAPLIAAAGLCDQDCPGYELPPFVGSLWPDETAEEFGHPVCCTCE